MNNRIPKFFQLDKYHITPEDVVQTFLHCDPEQIQTQVIIMPHWRAEIFFSVADDINEIVQGRLYQVKYKGQWISLVRSGIGAPQTGDMILALGCTPCREIIFTGSAGGLGSHIRIGDLIVVKKSLCGDGFSRYLDRNVTPVDIFLQSVEPDDELTERIKRNTKQACLAMPVSFYEGTVFSTDSILAQFFRLDHLSEELDCIGIEMETAAVFRAAKLVGIQAAALLQVSDAPQQNKSIFSGRLKEEMDNRKMIRQNVLSQAVLSSLLPQ